MRSISPAGNSYLFQLWEVFLLKAIIISLCCEKYFCRGRWLFLSVARSICVRQESYWRPASLSPAGQLCGKLPPGSSTVELLPSSWTLLTPTEDFSRFGKVFSYLGGVFLWSLQKYLWFVRSISPSSKVKLLRQPSCSLSQVWFPLWTWHHSEEAHLSCLLNPNTLHQQRKWYMIR